MFEISSSPVSAVIVTPQRDVGARVRDEHLGAVHDPRAVAQLAVVRVAPASEPASGSVRPNAASRAPRGEGGEPVLLLLLGAEQEDRHRPERGVRGDGDRDGRVDARELLDRDRIARGCRRPRRRAPRGTGSPSARARPSPRRARRGSGSRGRSPRRRARRARGERADGVAEELLLGREVEIHAARMVPAR